MERPEQHQIDEQAQQIFLASRPIEWVVNPLPKDYAKDYIVEVVEKERLTGKTFIVQLKGTSNIRVHKRKKNIAFTMEVKHLIYYAEKVRDPVFLVVCDVKEQVAYFVFIQEYLDVVARGIWKSQQTLDIVISTKFELGNSKYLLREVDRSILYMRSKWSDSVATAAENHMATVRQKDARFDVDVSYHGGVTSVNLQPVVPVNISFKLHRGSEKFLEKARDLFELGLPVEVLPNELEVVGTPLFDKIFAVGGKVHLRVEGKLEIEVSLLNEDGSCLFLFPEFKGVSEAGFKQARIFGSRPGFPFSFKFVVNTEDGKVEPRVAMESNLDISKWVGIPILNIPYFVQAYNFLESIKKSSRLKIIFRENGSELAQWNGSLNMNVFQDLLRIAGLVGDLNKARIVAHYFGINPVFGRVIEECREDLDGYVSLVESGECGKVYRNRGFEFGCYSRGEFPAGKQSMNIVANCSNYCVDFMGEKCDFGKCVQTIIGDGQAARDYTKEIKDGLVPTLVVFEEPFISYRISR
jgi:hypothetical protein